MRGGKQKNRDKDIKQYPPDFQRWYHREYKPKVGPGRDATPTELEEIYQEWIDLGKPVVKAVGQTVILIGIWEGIKWTGAILLAPETGGASLVLAAETP